MSEICAISLALYPGSTVVTAEAPYKRFDERIGGSQRTTDHVWRRSYSFSIRREKFSLRAAISPSY